MRKLWAIMTGIAILVILGSVLIYYYRAAARKRADEGKPWITYSRLMYFATHGCNEYKKQHGVWPTSLTQLREFGEDLNERASDMWGREFVFVPHNEPFGYGQLVSFGADGKPGGTNSDADIEVRFPSDANTVWNKQAGSGLKLPSRAP